MMQRLEEPSRTCVASSFKIGRATVYGPNTAFAEMATPGCSTFATPMDNEGRPINTRSRHGRWWSLVLSVDAYSVSH